MYEKFNITWDTSVTFMKNTDFPVMTDLYNTLLEQRKTAEKGVTDDMDKLILLLENITTGADSFLWNGHTTMQSNAQFIVFDTQNMKIMSDAKEKWNKLLGSKYEVTYSDDKYRIRQINIPDENLRKSCLDFAYAQAGYIPASEYDELFCNENRICIGNCYVNFGITTTSLTGETRQDCENLNIADCMTLYGRIALNNPVSCETALTVNAVSINGNTTVPLIVCRKGTFSYVNNWQTDKLLGNERMFKMIADKAKIEAKTYNKFEEEEMEV